MGVIKKSVITISNVSKNYKEQKILSDLNYSFYEDEILVILGPSGIGKSTLLRIIGTVEKYDEGSIHYDAEVYKHSVALPMVFQSYDQLLPWYTLAQNILLPYKNVDVADAFFMDLVKHLNIHKDLNKYPKSLSGGMKQRGAIARALMAQSKILLMDEPFGALDLVMRRRLQDLVRWIQKKYHQTIIFVTHDIEEAVYLADRLMIMKGPKRVKTLEFSSKKVKRYSHDFEKRVQEVIEIMKDPMES